jgi:hypothetical protein
MKLIIISISLFLNLSAFGKNVEDFEYYTVYSDFKVPSINAGMFVPSVGRKMTSPSEFKAARIKAIKKWSDKSYYAVSGTEVIKLNVKSFIDKLIEDGGGGKNYNLRILFEPIDKKVELVLTRPVKILKNELLSEKKTISKKQAKFLLNSCVSDSFSHVSDIFRRSGGFPVNKIGQVQLINNEYILKYTDNGKKNYSRIVALDVEPVGIDYVNAKLKIISFSGKLKSQYGNQILLYKEKAIVFFNKYHRDLRLESRITTSNQELYLFSYGTEFGPFGKTVYILKKEGNKFIELRNRHVTNVAHFYSDQIWTGWD